MIWLNYLHCWGCKPVVRNGYIEIELASLQTPGEEQEGGPRLGEQQRQLFIRFYRRHHTWPKQHEREGMQEMIKEAVYTVPLRRALEPRFKNLVLDAVMPAPPPAPPRPKPRPRKVLDVYPQPAELE